MINDIEKLEKKFYEIKEMGWIESIRRDSGGIGMTIEKLLGIEENQLEIPDFGDIEIKAKTYGSIEFTTLFNCVPTGPHYHEVERLKDIYGYPDYIIKDEKVLNANAVCRRLTKVRKNFYFMLKVDKELKKIFLCIYDKNKKLIEDEVYWDFDILKEKLYRKLKFTAIIKAKRKYINNKVYFNYYEMKILKLKNFYTFIKLIEDGVIKISFKISIYRNGNRYGKIHDRGTAFGISEKDFNKLYNIIKILN